MPEQVKNIKKKEERAPQGFSIRSGVPGMPVISDQSLHDEQFSKG